MSNQHIDLFVELSDEDKLLEQELEKQKNEASSKVTIAIKQHQPHKEFMDLKWQLHCSIRDLKGGVYADKGLRMPKNSTELADALQIKAKKVAYIEEQYLNGQLDLYRSEMKLIDARIENIITYCLQNGLDKKFNDFAFIIKCWPNNKRDIFKEPERCQPQVGNNSVPMLAKNIIGYYIQKLRYIQFVVGELNWKKTKETQVSSLISICEIVKSSTDDNIIFDQLFLMGQRSANLNNIESNINTLIAKDRSQREASSKSDWAYEMAQQVYLDYWIYGKAPTANEVGKNFPNLVHNRSTRTISNHLTNQRKLYSNIDNRVLPVKSKGRNKKV
ncbi:MAG: hypothetical protein JKX67_01595 [Colwellia sp.]|nr:hypothetical protein [Colwellia sp.]